MREVSACLLSNILLTPSASEKNAADRIASGDSASPRDVLNRFRHLRDYVHIESKSIRVTAKAAGEAFKLLAPTRLVEDSARQRQSKKREDSSYDPLKRRYQEFVSSTYDDMKDERKQVNAGSPRNEVHPNRDGAISSFKRTAVEAD